MKKLLADFLGIPENNIEEYRFNSEHDLRLEKEHDYGRSYDIITSGGILQPQYKVMDTAQKHYWVNLDELLVFIYNKNQTK